MQRVNIIIYLFILEANYAFFKKKHVVPIKVSASFQLDDWLKDLIGSKHFIDVTNNRPFEEHMTDILNALVRYVT